MEATHFPFPHPISLHTSKKGERRGDKLRSTAAVRDDCKKITRRTMMVPLEEAIVVFERNRDREEERAKTRLPFVYSSSFFL